MGKNVKSKKNSIEKVWDKIVKLRWKDRVKEGCRIIKKKNIRIKRKREWKRGEIDNEEWKLGGKFLRSIRVK